jgi:hypothetical protein
MTPSVKLQPPVGPVQGRWSVSYTLVVPFSNQSARLLRPPPQRKLRLHKHNQVLLSNKRVLFSNKKVLLSNKRVLPVLPILASAQNPRSSSKRALMAGRRPPSGQLTWVRDIYLRHDNVCLRSCTTASYNHGSAQNIHVLTDFMCLAMVNTCAANQAAKDLCAKAEAAADAATPPKSGVQADGSCCLY